MVEFACRQCGSPALALPLELAAEAPVHCARCGGFVSTWGAFKSQASRIVLAQGANASARLVASADPLAHDRDGARVPKGLPC